MEWSERSGRSDGGVARAGIAARLGPPLSPSLYSRLPSGRRGRNGPTAEEVAENQRARLAGALVQELATRGYEQLRTRELCERAGVSKRDFYRHYRGGAHECFMAVFEQIAEALIDRLVEAWLAGEAPAERLSLAVRAFVEMIADEPAAAGVALYEPFAAGAAALQAKQATEDRLRDLLAAGLEAHGIAAEPMLTQAMLIGLSSLARACLLDGRHGKLTEAAGELARWACCCLEAPLPSGASEGSARPAYRPSAHLIAKAHHRGERERTRIIAATAGLAAEHGFSALREPAIRSVAGVTRQQFRAHFAGHHDAFVAALDKLWADALRHAVLVGRAAPDWPSGVARGMREMLGCLAEDAHFWRLAFTELWQADGRAGMQGRLRLMRTGAGRLVAGAPDAAGLSAPVAEASIAAAWAIVHQRIEEGAQRTLVDLAPTLAFMVLAPSIGRYAAERAVGIPTRCAMSQP